MRDSVARIERHGLVAGSVARDRDYLHLLWDAGFRFLSYRNDAALLRDALATAHGWYGELAHG
jgi:2-keto-3-deoxy-L-rhamnonate aldolase RhmA